MEKSRVLVSHVDLDGVGIIVLALGLKISQDKILMLDYADVESDVGQEEIFEVLKEFDDIVVADFSFNKKVINKLLDLGKTIKIYDHHESSLKELGEIVHPNFVFINDDKRCGTKIFFENYCIPELNLKRVPVIYTQFVELVNTYDLWKESHELWIKACDLNRVLFKYKKWGESDPLDSFKNFIRNCLFKFEKYSAWKWTPNEVVAIEEDRQKELLAYKAAKKILKKRVDEKGRTFGIFAASSKISVSASKLLHEYPDLAYVIIINTYKDSSYTRLSFRSKEGRGVISTDLGFKGHALAGGETFASGLDLWEGRIKSLPYII